MPKRIQRKRTRGYRQPPNTRYCGRGTPYGNPFEMGLHEYGGITRIWTREEVVNLYEQELPVIAANLGLTLDEFLRPLLEYDYLSCFCGPEVACHVDVIIRKLARMNEYFQAPLLMEV